MRIGILGSGDVGKTLARGFLAEGYAVTLGTRNSNTPELATWRNNNAQVTVGSFAEAAEFGELLVLAVHYEGGASINTIELAGIQNFTGKVVIDATNPLDTAHGMPPSLMTPPEGSAGEQHQAYLPEAKVVKAFNMIGNAFMYQPKFDAPPDLFICGNDGAAKQTVAGIVKQFGLNPIDLGAMTQAHLLECLAMIWILYGLTTNTWQHAFRLMKKQASV